MGFAGLAALLASLAGACGGSSTPKANPQTLLHNAKTVIDQTSSVHFTLTSQNVSGGGINLTGGQGDIARPDQLQGSFAVTVNGFNAHVNVAAKGGVFLAQLPFQSHYSVTKPSSFGLGDPSQLLDPNRGLSNLLIEGTNAHVTGQERLAGELLYEVTSTVPGRSVPLLPNANPSKPVTVVSAINPHTYQLRQISLTGPFTSSSSNSTYTVTLTKYGEPVTITLPPT
jgi:lipoprotein LprG